MLGNSKKGN